MPKLLEKKSKKNPLSEVPLIEIEKNIYKRSFFQFCKNAWKVIEPGTVFQENWHLVEICTGIQKIVTHDHTEVKDLIIAVPPRSCKTRIISNFLNAWVWGPLGRPEISFICVSHTEQKSFDEAINTRKLIESPWYQERWPVKLSQDMNTKGLYRNTEGGGRLSAGAATAITGYGADIIVVDDPSPVQDADSPIELEKVNKWYDKTLSSRRNDPFTSIRIVCQQRINENDLIGHILDKKYPYEQIIFPMKYELGRFKSTLGIKDHRKKKNELLWPTRFPQSYIDQVIADDLGEDGEASQFQQHPSPLGGLIFKKEWFAQRINPNPNKIVARWISLDSASVVSKHAAYSAFAVFELLPDYRVFIREVCQDRLEIYDLQRETERLAYKYRDNLWGVLVERQSSGIQLLQMMQESSPAWIADLLIPVSPESDKVSRAKEASVWCQNGSVLLPPISDEFPWLFAFESQIKKFPNDRFKDMVDATTQGINFLSSTLAEGYHARHDIEEEV